MQGSIGDLEPPDLNRPLTDQEWNEVIGHAKKKSCIITLQKEPPTTVLKRRLGKNYESE